MGILDRIFGQPPGGGEPPPPPGPAPPAAPVRMDRAVAGSTGDDAADQGHVRRRRWQPRHAPRRDEHALDGDVPQRAAPGARPAAGACREDVEFDHPDDPVGQVGRVVATSTKPDVVRATALVRARRGRVWCYAPDGQTPIPPGLHELRWSPLRVAEDWSIAIQTANDITRTMKMENVEGGDHWRDGRATPSPPSSTGRPFAGTRRMREERAMPSSN